MAKKQSKPSPVSRTEPKPSIFISHDSRDAKLAEALTKLLTTTSMGLIDVFCSSDKEGAQGMHYGTEFYNQIVDQIANSCAVVALLTDRSVDRPWVLYETGLAKGSNVQVFGLVLGVEMAKVNAGPLSQFHNCAGDDPSVKKLVHELLENVPGLHPIDDIIDSRVKCFREEADKALAEISGGVSLEGKWYYYVRHSNGKFSHCGDCLVEHKGEKLTFDGYRKIESDVENSLQTEALRHWKTDWAQVCNDGKVRMQYQIALVEGHARINCDLDLNRACGEIELRGEFYLCPPFNKALPNTTHGPIVFTRHELEAGTPPPQA